MSNARRPIVAANWKMHGDREQLVVLTDGIVAACAQDDVDVVVCPPAPYLAVVADRLDGSNVALGAQEMSAHEIGAHTGDVAASMLLDVGCRYVILGHSERRVNHQESDASVAAKATTALQHGLTPIVCIGETIEQREAGETEAVLERQLDGSLAGLGDQLEKIVLAYEPVWAIGTGLSATSEQAQQAHAFIRQHLSTIGLSAAAVRIQYGGSVKPANAAELFGAPDIDGGLIGGASLQAESFAAIVAAAR